MLISQLPDKIREKALSLQKNNTDSSFDRETDVLFEAFEWAMTPQRYEFWEACFMATEEYDLPELI